MARLVPAHTLTQHQDGGPVHPHILAALRPRIARGTQHQPARRHSILQCGVQHLGRVHLCRLHRSCAGLAHGSTERRAVLRRHQQPRSAQAPAAAQDGAKVLLQGGRKSGRGSGWRVRGCGRGWRGAVRVRQGCCTARGRPGQPTPGTRLLILFLQRALHAQVWRPSAPTPLAGHSPGPAPRPGQPTRAARCLQPLLPPSPPLRGAACPAA